jgi:hypothetical protein
MPQLLTAQDEENYGPELLDMSKRAALEALSPALQQLRAENQQLRHQQQRAQRSEIEHALNQQIPNWRDIYADPRFSSWLSMQDDYSGGIRSQLMRNAVANGDARRVVQFYRGFQQEAGQPQYQSRQSRQPATGAKRIYSREDIRRLYEQRRLGHINDAAWARTEQEIFNAANEGRIAGALDRDGNKLTELR